MHIGILEAGHPPKGLAEKYGSYAGMIQRLLEPLDPSWTFQSFPVYNDVLPDVPSVCDAWIVSGSRRGVYENIPWIVSLKTFLQDSIALGIPVVGFCFGHQVLAAAMGGNVQKSPKGWGLGTHTYTIKSVPAFVRESQEQDDTYATLSLYAVHQDQVIDPPPGAQVIASSDFCPYAALSYGHIAFSVQAHPEFSKDFEKALLTTYRETFFSEKDADDALRTLESPHVTTNAEVIAQWVHSLLTDPRHEKTAH